MNSPPHDQDRPESSGPPHDPPAATEAGRTRRESRFPVPEELQSDQPPPAEETLWVGRTHWKHYGGSIAAVAVGALVLLIGGTAWFGSASLPYTAAVIVLAVLAQVIRIAAVILGTRYRLTTERLFVERGLIRQTIDQTELIRVDDVRVRKLMVDRILGLGSIDVLSTDQTDPRVVVTGVAEAEKVAEMIRQHMRALRRRSLFVENL